MIAETPEQLLQQLYDAPYGRTWWHTVDHLVWHGAAAVPALTAALGAVPAPVRRAAAQSLGRIGVPARSAAPALVRCLFDPVHHVRGDAAHALAQIAPPLKSSVPLLVGRLATEDNLWVRRSLMRVLGNIGPSATAAVALLVPHLDDDDTFPDALYALRSIAPDHPRLRQILYERLTTPGAPGRALAAEAIGKLRLAGPEWLAALHAASGSADGATRHAASNALRKLRAAARLSGYNGG
jgi:HEAT repeat protein